MTFAFFSWNLETSTWLKFFFFLGIKSQERYWYSESTMDNVKNVDKSSYNGGALLRMGLNDNKAGMQGLDKEKINKIIMEASKVGLIIFIFPCQQIYAHLPFPNRWSWWDWIFNVFSRIPLSFLSFFSCGSWEGWPAVCNLVPKIHRRDHNSTKHWNISPLTFFFKGLQMQLYGDNTSFRQL